MVKSKIVLAIALMVAAASAQALAIRDAGLFNNNTLAANDDLSTPLVNIGFSVNINGTSYSQLYVNNNGNVSFTNPISAYTPTGIINSAFPIIAPFWADVDTRGEGSGLAKYGAVAATSTSAASFGVNWIDVGFYSNRADKLNSFQLILTNQGSGDFQIEFNYDKIQWETGEATSSAGTDGLGGNSARAGYTIGPSAAVELLGSGVNGAFLDGGPNGTRLIGNSRGSDVLGRYIFNGRGGVIVPVEPPSNQVPLPGTLALIGLGLIGFSKLRRK